jgi:DNA-binding response OmpR family regulator
MRRRLEGLTILVVEDEYLVAKLVCDMIKDNGGVVVGPAPDVTRARSLLAQTPVDGAILDVKLDQATSFPLADSLISDGTPVIFATGYDTPHLPEIYADIPRLPKPFRQQQLVKLAEASFRR